MKDGDPIRAPWVLVQGAGINRIDDADGRTVCECVPAGLEPLMLAVPEMLAVLLKVEWGGTNLYGESCCPSCFGEEEVGHRADCALAAVIAKATRPDPTPPSTPRSAG
jgi:hypothetical protein